MKEWREVFGTEAEQPEDLYLSGESEHVQFEQL